MKKIAILLTGFLASCVCANAYIDNQYMTTEQFLSNVGYSPSISGIIKGRVSDPYREQYVEGTDLKTRLRRAYWYIAPGENDDEFFNNQSIYTNGYGWKDI
ncbi:MAG: hypothetical protein LUG16_01170 [Candidatus Gastranaerophilales bacterium]|nr:hypothetical protein [Candidatus Gastranaerophilales bacterium]